MVGWHPWAMKRLVTKYDDVDRGVDRLARILVCRGASIVMCAVGGCRACGVECVAGLSCGSRVAARAKRAGPGRISHLDLQRKLHLDLKGVDLLCVERRRRCDDEW